MTEEEMKEFQEFLEWKKSMLNQSMKKSIKHKMRLREKRAKRFRLQKQKTLPFQNQAILFLQG